MELISDTRTNGLSFMEERGLRSDLAWAFSFLDEPPLSKHAGGRQRNRLRRDAAYPKGNEPKPWSKRSKKRAAQR